MSYDEGCTTMTEANGTWDVYLSYSKEEAPFVRAVAAELRHLGVEPWFDELRLQAGTHWLSTVTDALAKSDFVVFFVGESPSPWAYFEFGVAVDKQARQGKVLVPVFLSDRALDQAPTFMRQRAGIDAHDLKPEQVAEQIAEAVGTGT